MRESPVHLYWGRNTPLSFTRFMTVVSLRVHNPERTIVVWSPGAPVINMAWSSPEHKSVAPSDVDWFPALSQFAFMRRAVVDLPKGCSEIHRSDLLRWQLLADGDCVWSDFDIFYYAPLRRVVPTPDSSWDIALVRKYLPEVNTQRRITTPYLPIGLLASSGTKGAERFFDHVSVEARDALRANEYQSAGRRALEKCEPKLPETIWIPSSAVYGIPICQLGPVWRGRYTKDPDAIGLHWYAGNAISQVHSSQWNVETVERLAPTNALARMMWETWNEV